MGGLPANRTVNGFAVNPADPKIMLAAMRDGLFRSANAGQSWQRVGTELKNLAAVAFNPKKSTEVFLSALDGTIYLSADAGIKWQKQR